MTSSESGTRLDGKIEQVWNWTNGSRESGTGRIDRASQELDR